MADILQDRQAAGKETTLRQLHAVSGLDQPQALRLLRQMQDAGLVDVEPDLHDPFASLVTLLPEALGALDEVLLQD